MAPYAYWQSLFGTLMFLLTSSCFLCPAEIPVPPIAPWLKNPTRCLIPCAVFIVLSIVLTNPVEHGKGLNLAFVSSFVVIDTWCKRKPKLSDPGLYVNNCLYKDLHTCKQKGIRQSGITP